MSPACLLDAWPIALGLSLPGARSRLQRARIRLRQRLVDAGQVRLDEAGKVCCFTSGPAHEPTRSLTP